MGKAKNVLKVSSDGRIALKLGPLTFINGYTWTQLWIGWVCFKVSWSDSWLDYPSYLALTIRNDRYCFELDWNYYFSRPIWEWYHQQTITDVWRQKRWE
jgi:hypothetical protein